MMTWKPVFGFAGAYEISDVGEVARVSTHGAKPKPIRRLLRPYKKNGYLAVDLQVNGKRSRCYIHRMLYEAFRAPIPSGLEINHRDGNRENNRLDNLELVTRSDNMLHCFQNLSPSLNRVRGSDHHKAKLKPSDIPNIFKMRRAGNTHSEIAEMFGVSKTMIGNVLNGRNWRHVTVATPD